MLLSDLLSFILYKTPSFTAFSLGKFLDYWKYSYVLLSSRPRPGNSGMWRLPRPPFGQCTKVNICTTHKHVRTFSLDLPMFRLLENCSWKKAELFASMFCWISVECMIANWEAKMWILISVKKVETKQTRGRVSGYLLPPSTPGIPNSSRSHFLGPRGPLRVPSFVRPLFRAKNLNHS